MEQSEKVPYEIKLNDEPFLVLPKPSDRLEFLKDHPEAEPRTVGLIAIGAFRRNTYVDYIAIARIYEEDEQWTRVHEMYEYLDWMAGTVYQDDRREKELKDTERRLGRFFHVFGWSPDYVLEDSPSEYEMESFINHVVSKDEVDGQLTLPEDE